VEIALHLLVDDYKQLRWLGWVSQDLSKKPCPRPQAVSRVWLGSAGMVLRRDGAASMHL